MAPSLAYHTPATAATSAASPIEIPIAMLALSLCDNPPVDAGGFGEYSMGDGVLEEAVWYTLGAVCDDGTETS